ncbi:hypothetical protein PVAP13_4NG238500 [Panicum virgatum]|uniref:Pentatricopeptide repeat-containing protein n=1 Tax=Panicum virgatum TaxID=38727 RepID=A0A8T0TCI6_PANVG|nr:hypothetical protein PVAP13_4NG238500 [Panicum virgatum]
MPTRDAVSWTTFVSGLSCSGQHRCTLEGMAVHAYMVQHEVKPTVFLGTALVDLNGKHVRLSGSTRAFAFVCKKEITFVALLMACARAGMVEIGLYWFQAMVADYKMTPLLGPLRMCCGLIRPRCPFYGCHSSYKSAPDASLWGALLGACRLHGNVELAVEVGQKLMALGPCNQAGVRMGEVMLEVGIKKIVGKSSVVLHGHAIP